MAVAGSLTYDTEIDSKGFEKGLKNLQTQSVALGNIIASAFEKVTSTISDAVISGIKYNGTIEQLKTSFEVMTGSADKATQIVEELKKIGARTPFEFTGLAETVQLLMNYGLTADDAIDKMEMLGDISQGSSEKMNRIAMAYGQMSSAGKVQLEDIKQMIEAGFNPLREIADSTGESMASLYDRISKGTISVDEITASMERSTSVGGKYFQSMDKQSTTLNGQLSTLQDNFNNFIGTALEPINEVLVKKILPKMNEFLGLMTEKISQINLDELINNLQILAGIISTVGTAFLGWKVGTTIQTLVQNFQKAQIALSLYSLQANGASVAQGLLNGTLTIGEGLVGLLTGKITLAQMATTLWTKAQTALNAVLSANPIALIVTLIATLVTAIIYLWNTNEGFRNALTSAWETIKSTAISVWNAVGEFFTTKIPEWIQGVIDWFKELPYNIGYFIGQVLGYIVKFGIDAYNWVKTELPKIIDNIINWFSQLPGRIWNWLLNTINKIGQWITDIKNKIVNGFPSVIDSIMNFFEDLPNKVKTIGKNIIEGLWQGIQNAKDWLLRKISGFASGIIDGFKSALGIHSPSTVMAYWSKFLPEGVAVGIEANTDTAIKAIDDMNNEIEKKMKNAVYTEMGKVNTNATVKANNSLMNETTINSKIEGTVEIEGKTAGRLLAPYVTQTYRKAGAY